MTDMPLADLAAIRRTDDGMIAGVCTGIARQWNIDPVIIRIAFVVLLIFGGAGAIVYLGCWLLLPAGSDAIGPLGRALGLGDDQKLRTWGLIGLVGVAALTLTGGLGSGISGGLAWTTLACAIVAAPVIGIIWLFSRRRKPLAAPTATATTTATATAQAYGTATTSTPWENTMSSSVTDAPDDSDTTVQPPPRRTRTWSPTLFVATISAMLAALGGLWLADQLGAHVVGSAYPALALAVVTAGLFVSTRFGDGGLLIPVGLVLTVILAIGSAVPELNVGQTTVRPTTAESAVKPITLGVGEVDIDLTGVVDPQNLAGKTLRIDVGIGQTDVTVPATLPVSVDATVKRGDVDIFDSEGKNTRVTVPNVDPNALRIIITQNAGEIEVSHP